MCGIAGIVRADPGEAVDEQALLRMARAIRHRGPDGFGLLLDPGAGLVSTRLAIFDLEHGWQPLVDGSRPAASSSTTARSTTTRSCEPMRSRGDEFGRPATPRSSCAARARGPAGLGAPERPVRFRLVAAAGRRLTLVRDRFGVRPLHWSLRDDGTLVFGSEAKALFASGEVAAAPDLAGIDEVFTLWGPRPPRTAFAASTSSSPAGCSSGSAARSSRSARWWEPGRHAAPRPSADLERAAARQRRLAAAR